jgi:hypothetical protein
LSAGTLFGELFNKLVVFGDLSLIDHINTVALSLFIVIPFILKNNKLIVFSTLFGFIMGILTLYRRILLIATIAIISGVMYYFKDLSVRKKVISFTFLMVFSFFVYTYRLTILEFLINALSLDSGDDYYRSATYRLIVKLTSTDNASDYVRRNVWNEIFTEFDNKLIPPGPIGKFMGVDYFGAYTDTTNVFLYDVFGSVLAWLFFIPILIKGLSTFLFVFIKKTTNNLIILSGLLFPIFIIFIMVDGTFLVHANIAILASFAFAGWFKKPIGNNVYV